MVSSRIFTRMENVRKNSRTYLAVDQRDADAHWGTRKIDQCGISTVRASCLSTLGLRVLGRRISCIAMRPLVDGGGMRRFLKVMASTSENLCEVLSQEREQEVTRDYIQSLTRSSKYAKLLRVVKYARTLKSITRPPLLFIKVPVPPRPAFLAAVVPITV